jgi:hypothetical protein
MWRKRRHVKEGEVIGEGGALAMSAPSSATCSSPFVENRSAAFSREEGMSPSDQLRFKLDGFAT